jgi:signal transduction histidine kinase
MTARGNAKLVSMTKRSSGVDNSPDPASEQGLLRQVAHDLRQPVAAILALAAAAESVPDVPVPVLRRLDQISEEAGWIFKVIGELLADGGQGTEPVAIDALIRDVVDSERLTFPGQIRLWQPAGDVRYVTAASTRLRRALANVLANATRAAGPQGHVELVVRSHGNTQIIEIIDDGPGFGQVGQVHGIGLQITRQILADCGGRMEIERRAPDRTVVRLWLPLLSRDHGAGGR